MSALCAWSNGYECVAARSAEEAQRILVEMGHDPDDIEGDGWFAMGADRKIVSEDGDEAETVGNILRESALPRFLFSVER